MSAPEATTGRGPRGAIYRSFDADAVLSHYGRLVPAVAKRFAGRLPPGMEMADLLQEGYLALFQAGRAFDPERGVRFTTYAYTSILRQMERAVRAAEPEVALPEHGYGSVTRDFAPALIDKHAVRQAVARLPEPEQTVARLRYGLDGGVPLSGSEIARRIGVARSTVGNLDRRLLARLRADLAVSL